ncbi:MAG: hypothetical protein R3F42_03220 [Pseudomonadota bacterium]
METPILDRYTRTDDGRLIIDIAANRVEELYSDYDNTANFLKKDLEPDLVEYLVESVREIGAEPFAVRFSFARAVDSDSTSRVMQSINTYFTYLVHLETRELKQMFRTSFIMLLAGLALLTLSVRVNLYVEHSEAVIARVFAEGLTVAAWVALWNALATFLLNWAPYRRLLALYQRIAQAPVLFSTRSGADAECAPQRQIVQQP